MKTQHYNINDICRLPNYTWIIPQYIAFRYNMVFLLRDAFVCMFKYITQKISRLHWIYEINQIQVHGLVDHRDIDELTKYKAANIAGTKQRQTR